jgi:hypothetical protein
VQHNVSAQQDALCAFSLLQLIAATCFEHLFTHHQEVLYTQQLVYFVLAGLEWNWLLHSNSASSQLTKYAQKIIPTAVCTAPPDDQQTVHPVGPVVLICSVCTNLQCHNKLFV